MKSLPLKEWEILNRDPNISLIDVLLKNRNLPQNHLDDFKLSDRLHDPYLLCDMDRAVERISLAVKNKESIVVFGDYDVDGVVSTTLMMKLFEEIGFPSQYILPNRQRDGYGLKESALEKAKQMGADLLITVDNGITSNDAVAKANKNGIDVIVFDHHVQEGDLPPAYAVVDPNRKDCSYPFKGLCGAGVVYKLFHALGKTLFSGDQFKNFMLKHLDLIALATIADVVPLRDENYALVKFGLKSLNQTMRPGIVELKRTSGLLGKEITTTAVGYYLAPRINAAGRLEDADMAVQLLLSKSRQEASEIAIELNKLNSRRQRIQENYIQQAIQMVENSDLKQNKAYVVVGDDWETGLIGIVSGRLKDKFNRPVIAFTKDDEGNYVGSARSTDHFHITDALSQFNKLYITYGGHHKAAGLTISTENFPVFVEKFNQYSNSIIDNREIKSNLIIDTVILPEQLNTSLVKIIRDIGPFGEENDEPILLLENAQLKELFPLSGGLHLKLIVQLANREFECVWWGKGDYKNEITFNQKYDIAFKPSLNLWNGKETLQLVVEDIKCSDY